MIINNIDFEIIQNVKKIKKIYVRLKNINNKNCIVINTYKKLSVKEINDLINRNKQTMDKLIKNMKVNPLKDNEVLILGKVYDKKDYKQLFEYSINEITKMFNNYKTIFNKHNTLLKFRKMKTRWGVCHITKNYINLSTYLIHIPLEIIEYVIIHEFCHFKHPNHSKQFYIEVSKYCPNYKEMVKELKKYSYVMN